MRPLLGRMLTSRGSKQSRPTGRCLDPRLLAAVFGSDPSVIGQTLDLTVKKAVIVGVLEPGSHYATQRKQDFYVNYAANDHYMSASMQDERIHRMTESMRGSRRALTRPRRRRNCGRLLRACMRSIRRLIRNREALTLSSHRGRTN